MTGHHGGSAARNLPALARLMLPQPATTPAYRWHIKEHCMIAHTSLAVRDYRKSKAFYIKALDPLGYRNNMEYGESAGFNDGKNTDFWITKENAVTPLHVAFEAKSSAEVEAFHKAALAAGGKDNGGPGYRDYWPGYYAAFVHDLDGNNIEAVWYDYSKAK
jgi:catechol 2,3-dioxygenase-like lactoylglutathione lyase family enzyme